MFNRSLFKSNAKESLKRFYGLALVVVLILTVVSSIGSSISGKKVETNEFSEAYTEYLAEPSDENYQMVMAETQEMAEEAAPSGRSLIGIAFTVLVTNILAIGANRFYLSAREYPANIGNLFHGYKNGFGRNVLTMFLRDLYVGLWSLLFIVPGIVKGYEYSMIPYILAENPTISKHEAFKLSKRMTKGYKGDLFVLDLSFLGWIILGLLTCGIGYIFLDPYINATKAEAYTFLKARALENGEAEPSDFPGIVEAA